MQPDERRPSLPKGDAATELGASTTCGRVRRFFSAVAVEPVCFLYAVTFGMTMALLPNLWLDKVCPVQLDYGEETFTSQPAGGEGAGEAGRRPEDVCPDVPLLPGHALPAGHPRQPAAGGVGGHARPPAPRAGPVVGSLLMALVVMANCHWWSLPPVFLLLASLPAGCTGSMRAVFSGSYAYVGAAAGRRRAGGPARSVCRFSGSR